jgi:RNA polymerase sigma-70 factor (ECF subfamily)
MYQTRWLSATLDVEGGNYMRTIVVVVLVLAIFATVPVSVSSEEVSVQEMPPVVVQTIPESGTTGVEPSLSEIKVTFSKDMMDRNWSWVQMSPDTFPELLGQPYYLHDRRTCVARVKLEPGKTYVIWFNSERFSNFRDRAGRSAIPYLLVFETSK